MSIEKAQHWFKVTSENTGGGCIVYAATGTQSNLSVMITDELATIMFLDNGTVVNGISEEINKDEKLYDQAWNGPSVIIWQYNTYYPDNYDIPIGLLKALGFTSAEIKYMPDIIKYCSQGD